MPGPLIEEQEQHISYFFKFLNPNHIRDFSQILLRTSQNQGLIFLAGMGKSGIVAQIISQLLVSIGIRAMYLSPTDALHGDLGVLTKRDTLVLLSRSGQTDELLNLVPAAKAKEAKIVSLTSNPASLLAQQADQSFYLPHQGELCPFDLAPTTSSVIQLLFGNITVSYLMRQTNLTREQYALNHPAGRIGKRLTLKVQNIMRALSELPLAYPDQLLIDQIQKMSAKRCGCLLVIPHPSQSSNPSPRSIKSPKLIGIFTDGDLRRAIEKHGQEALQLPLQSLMTRDPFHCHPDQLAFECMQEMERDDLEQSKKRIKEMPVLDPKSNQLVGLLTLHDLVKSGL
jgi:arabinose-5-phosphate isomerase